MQARALILFLISISILSGGCADPNAQAATASNGVAGEAARHLMESSRNGHYVSPAKLALIDPGEPKEATLSGPSVKAYRIAVCLAGIDEDFDKAFTAGIQEQAKKRMVTVDVVSAGGSPSKQASQLEGFQKAKENALIVVPVQAKSLSMQVAALNSNKVAVIGAGQSVPGAASEVITDEAKAGEKAMIAIWGALLKKQSGSVGAIAFKADPTQKERLDGFALMEKHVPNVKGSFEGDLVQNTAGAAQAKAAEMLHAHPNISAIFAADDALAEGVRRAITGAKMEVGLISVGADANAREQVTIGDPWFADVIEYPHLIGLTSLDAAVKVLQGDKIPPNIVIPVALVLPTSFK